MGLRTVNCLRNLFNSGVQKSRKKKKKIPFQNLAIHTKAFRATNQTFVLISFILYGDKNKFAGVVVHCASLYKMLFTKNGEK